MMKAQPIGSGMSADLASPALAGQERSNYNEVQALRLRVQSLRTMLQSCKTALQNGQASPAETSQIVAAIDRELATVGPV